MLTTLLTACVLAGTVHVPADAATIQAGIDLAVAGETVLVAPGVYTSADPITFRGKSISVVSGAGSSATTIRMAEPTDPLRASVVLFESAEPESAVLEGFTISGGTGTRWGGGSEESGGGGVLSRNGARAVVRNCVLTGNSGRNGGGAMCDTASSLLIEGCTIARNIAGVFGGGVFWVSTGTDPVLKDSTITQNVASSGGALFCYSGASPRITGCRVEGNLANSVAGGLCCLFESSPTISSTLWLGNYASGGGAISCETASDNPLFVNCLIAGNHSFTGAGLQTRDGSTLKLVNCTVTSNLAIDFDGGITCPGGSPVIVNSIISGNAPPSVCGTVSTSITEETDLFVSQGNYDFDRYQTVDVAGQMLELPDFILELGDYHLLAGCPAVDAAASNSAPATDIEGTERSCGQSADCGAFERCGDPPPNSFRRGDANGDRRTDLSDAVFSLDFLFLGKVVPTCKKSLDFDDSGTLNVSDAIYLLGFLFLGGPPPPAPAASCGVDPSGDTLTCDSFPECAA